MPVNISAITEAGAPPPQRGAEAAEGADRQLQLQQQQKGNQQQVIFHVTAYNSQVEKILDVRLVQPGKTVHASHTHAYRVTHQTQNEMQMTGSRLSDASPVG